MNASMFSSFKYFLCLPLNPEMIQFDEYFPNGLVQPPPSLVFASAFVTFEQNVLAATSLPGSCQEDLEKQSLESQAQVGSFV